MKKIFIVLFFCINASGFKANAQDIDPQTAYNALTKGQEVFNKAQSFGKWLGCGFSHRWWCCRYENGTIVYNNFRCHRNGADVYNYFTGQTGGDCDSFYYNSQGKKVHVCYRGYGESASLVNRFGRIAEIYPY